MTKAKNPESANLRRHKKQCAICAHGDREQIERDFIGWKSPITICREHGLSDRSTVYRHAQAFDLFAKRRRNVRAALERIIEKAGEVEVSSSAVVAAVQAYAKINAQGHWVDRTEHVDLNALFDRMTKKELEIYAQSGKLPGWFSEAVGAAVEESESAVSA
jgi:hypothetical protein